jgi:hypothetical protein
VNRYRKVILGDEYVAHFTWVERDGEDRLFVKVAFEGTLVAKDLFGGGLNSRIFGVHYVAASWVRGEVRSHKKAMRILRKGAA